MALTIKDIARLTGTSPTAVSFVLNNKDAHQVSLAKRQAILAAVKKHGYRRNSIARGLKLQRTFHIAVCIQGFLYQYPIFGCFSFHDILSAITREFHQADYRITLLQIDRNRPLGAIARELEQEAVDGFLFLYWDPKPLQKLMFLLDQQGVPAVAIESALDATCSWGLIDQRTSFYNGTRYMLDQGLTRLVMMDIDAPVNPNHLLKKEGYEQAIREYGLKPLAPVFIRTLTVTAAFAAVQELSAKFPNIQALLLTDNYFAPQIVNTLHNRPIRILGFGDAVVAEPCDPKLSFLRFPIEKLTESCVTMLLDRIREGPNFKPRQVRLPCELVIQDT